MDKDYYPERFFDFLNTPYSELGLCNTVWDVVRILPGYVRRLFALGYVKRVSFARRVLYRVNGVYVSRQVSVGEGTVIYPGAYIADWVVIGKNCIIGQNTTLKGPLILCDDCVIGPSGEVGASFFFPGARAAHKNFIGESLVGRDVNLGAGSETANWKLDGSEIGLWIDGERVQTGLTKFGAVIGDGSSVGGNSVFHPGALLGKNCRVGPLVTISNRYFGNGTILKD